MQQIYVDGKDSHSSKTNSQCMKTLLSLEMAGIGILQEISV